MTDWIDTYGFRAGKWTPHGIILVACDTPGGWFAIWIGDNKLETIAHNKPTQAAAKAAATRWYLKHYGEE